MPTMPTIKVTYKGAGVYLVHLDSDVHDDYERLRAVLEQMFESGRLKRTSFTIGSGGGYGFELGTVKEEPMFTQVENWGDSLTLLEAAFEERLTAPAA